MFADPFRRLVDRGEMVVALKQCSSSNEHKKSVLSRIHLKNVFDSNTFADTLVDIENMLRLTAVSKFGTDHMTSETGINQILQSPALGRRDPRDGRGNASTSNRGTVTRSLPNFDRSGSI